MKVMVTGANGFIGRNLCQRLSERADIEVATYGRESTIADLPHRLAGADFVIHLAGANRPADPAEFWQSNHALTASLCAAVVEACAASARRIPILLASSTQAQRSDGPYAQSKRAAEESVAATCRAHGLPAHIFRLPNVFGKWSRPNYNSVVATFCWNIARGLPIEIHDPAARLVLAYVDDVVERFIEILDGGAPRLDADGFEEVAPLYETTVGALADDIRRFRESRSTLAMPEVGTGLLRALHATYLSCLPERDFAYPLREHADARGRFVEVLKTAGCGQFSYFTAAPGITRGGHYHHTKAEKFVVLQGHALFRFRHVQDGRRHEIRTSGEHAEVVETVPGWSHDITNIGSTELIVMLWANEVFDPGRPDTHVHPT